MGRKSIKSAKDAPKSLLSLSSTSPARILCQRGTGVSTPQFARGSSRISTRSYLQMQIRTPPLPRSPWEESRTHVPRLDWKTLTGDAPQVWQHARACAEGQLRAQSLMQRSAGPTGQWRSDVRGSATSATQPIQLPTHSDRSPPLTAQIGPKLGRNIEHWWYDGSPVNRSTAIP